MSSTELVSSTATPAAAVGKKPLAIQMTWAQRVRTILLTCSVMDASDVNVFVNPNNPRIVNITLMAPPTMNAAPLIGAADAKDTTAALNAYEENLEMFEAINPSTVMIHITGRNVYIRLTKANNAGSSAAFWPRLLKDSAEQKRKRHISVDWGLWKDEEDIAEEAEEEEFASIGPLRAFTMSNGVNVNGGGDPDVVARLLNGEHSSGGQ